MAAHQPLALGIRVDGGNASAMAGPFLQIEIDEAAWWSGLWSTVCSTRCGLMIRTR